MELRNFYILLKKHRLTLIIVPIMAAMVTFFLIRKKSNSYKSTIQIATGIVDQSQRVLGNQDGYVQDSKILEEFTNLIETAKLDKVVDQVSFKLLLHDLTDATPFKPENQKYLALSTAQKKQVISILDQKLANFETLDVNVPMQKMIDSLLVKTGYDREALLKKILIYRLESSDFIYLEAEAPSPDLSAFIANNLTDRFITYYANYVNSGHSRSNDFFAKLLVEKREAMNQKIAALEAFKVKNGILDVGDESKDVYTQISDLETHRQQAEKDVIAYSGALKSIDSKFNPKDRQYMEAASSKINGKILGTRERIRTLNDKYIQSDFNPKYKKSIDSLQDMLSSQINESSDNYATNPMAAKDDIVQEKLKMENQLELARYSASSLRNQLNNLKSKMSGMVPAQASVKSFERDIDIATKEYLDVQDKYNQANVSAIAPVQLRQLQPAMPGKIQSSKKIMIVGLSGVTTFICYMVVLLIIFYLDNSVRNADDLERLTDIRILGHLNVVPNSIINPRKPLADTKGKNDMRLYRDLLRSIRYEIDRELKGGKVLAVTSLNKGEGKTLFSFSLAYAYSLTNKKVLLIDGNFTNPVISQTVKSKEYIEDYFKNDHLLEAENAPRPIQEPLAGEKELKLLEINSTTAIGDTIQRLSSQPKNDYSQKESISILGNRGADVTILEISDETHIQKKMEELKSRFDMIIIEAGSLNTLNKSKEWLMFADKSVAVFENNQALNYTNIPAIKYLRSLNGNLLGWVLNKVDIGSAETTQI